MAHQVDVPGGASGPVADTAAAEKPDQSGLRVAMALIVGSIIASMILWRWIDHKTAT